MAISTFSFFLPLPFFAAAGGFGGAAAFGALGAFGALVGALPAAPTRAKVLLRSSMAASEARALANNFALGGHHWGELHTHKDELRSAMELEQKPYEAYRRALRAALPAAASSTTTRRRGQSALLPGEELAHD